MSDSRVREVRPGENILLEALGLPTGLVGHPTTPLSIRIVDPITDAIVIAASETGINEVSQPSGNYAKLQAIPGNIPKGLYAAEWIYGDIEVLDEDIIRVASIALASIDNEPTPGTGTVPEVGIESIFTMEEFVFNDKISSLSDGVFVETISGFEDADLRLSAEENPQEDGETPGPGLYGGRTMTITGFIGARTVDRMRDIKYELRKAFRNLEERPLLIESPPVFDYPSLEIYCRKMDKISIPDQQDNMSPNRPFQITLRASDPRYLSPNQWTENVDITTIVDYGHGFPHGFPLEFDILRDENGDPIVPPINQAIVHNSGDWPALPIIRIRGPITGLPIILENSANGHKIRIIEEIAEDDYVEIDVENGTVVNAVGELVFYKLDETSDWMRIEPLVDNVLTLQTGPYGIGSGFDVTWRDTWL